MKNFTDEFKHFVRAEGTVKRGSAGLPVFALLPSLVSAHKLNCVPTLNVYRTNADICLGLTSETW